MNTNLTWWGMSDQLHAYLARTGALLMQGDFVADVAYYYGHAIPNFAKAKHLRPGLGRGYDYDDLNTEVLLRASVDDQGNVVLPSGMRYSVLVLPQDDPRMDLKVLEQIESLLLQGATVIGNKPEGTYGLRDVPQQRQLLELADHIWGTESPSGPHHRKYGRGRLVVGKSERDVLRDLAIPPDLRVRPAEAESFIDFIHRRGTGADIYFIRNTQDRETNVELEFRVGPSRPELWDSANATMIAPALYEETETGIRLPLQLPAHGSRFVVLFDRDRGEPHITSVMSETGERYTRRDLADSGFEAYFDSGGDLRVHADKPGRYRLRLSDGKIQEVTITADCAPFEMDGSWEVRFPFGWKVPTRQVFDSLVSWTESEDAATRSFSGTAIYAKQFDVDRASIPDDGRVVLDLGEVREIARVYLNGKEVGISSFAPHQLDVTDLIRSGDNSLVVEVANTWLNRLIADDSLPENERLTHTNLTRGPALGMRWRDAEPKPSGLLGPVRLVYQHDVIVGESTDN
jgi:hypothetical protein